MKPTKVPITDKQIDLFRPELSKIIDPRHSLVNLSRVVNGDDLDDTFGITFCDDNGRPGKPTRLMVALYYLKFTQDLSDEDVVSGWVENPYW